MHSHHTLSSWMENVCLSGLTKDWLYDPHIKWMHGQTQHGIAMFTILWNSQFRQLTKKLSEVLLWTSGKDGQSYKAQLLSPAQCFRCSEIHDIAEQLMENNEWRNWQHPKLLQRSEETWILVRYGNVPIQAVRYLITQTIRVQNCETKVSIPILGLIWITEYNQAKKILN